jgi:hypothetical protein
MVNLIAISIDGSGRVFESLSSGIRYGASIPEADTAR